MERTYQAMNTIKDFLISSDGLDLEYDGHYYLKDNAIDVKDLDVLAYNLYKRSMEIASSDIRESKIENETKVPCDNRV